MFEARQYHATGRSARESNEVAITTMDARLSAELDRRLKATSFTDRTYNPVLRALRDSTDTSSTSARALIEYCYLPSVIAELLSRGVTKLFDWPEVRDELLRNLGEEMGTRSDGETHFSILRRCLAEEATIEFPPDATASAPTAAMIALLRVLISDRPRHEAAGALYALESSAVPELKVVGDLVNIRSQAALGRMIVRDGDSWTAAPCNGPWTLDRFLAAHINDFELGHRNNLNRTLSQYVRRAGERKTFMKGFDHVLDAMETWWSALSRLS